MIHYNSQRTKFEYHLKIGVWVNDSQFTTTLMVIIGVLVASTVGILALANVLISDADY